MRHTLHNDEECSAPVELTQIQGRLFLQRGYSIRPENSELQPYLKRNHAWTAVAAQADS